MLTGREEEKKVKAFVHYDPDTKLKLNPTPAENLFPEDHTMPCTL